MRNNKLPIKLTLAGARLTFVRIVPGFNLGGDTGYHNRDCL